MKLRMLRRLVVILVMLGGAVTMANAQETVFPIWKGVPTGSENWTHKEVAYQNPQKQTMVRNVVTPTLTVYLPPKEKATGTGVIVCPGGGYRFLSWENEGTEVAKWLASHGVAAFVLKYRLVDTGATEADFQNALARFFENINKRQKEPAKGKILKNDPEADIVVPLAIEDGKQAIRVVRERALEWGLASNRVGIMGFSAGGIVASEAALHYDAACRPAFVAPIYGSPAFEYVVPSDAPPMFILCASDDAMFATRSIDLYSRWLAAGKRTELHLYNTGGHGFGMNKRGLPVDNWIERFGEWLKGLGLLEPVH